jgi:transcription factor WhiB
MTTFPQLALAESAALHPVKARALTNRIVEGWQDQGACAASEDEDAWFPDPSTPRSELTAVLRVCQGCPVRRSCLAAGLVGQEAGVWGGTTEAERNDAAIELSSTGSRTDDVLDRLLALPVATPAAAPERGAA